MKQWKPFWVELNGFFLDISAEYGKDPFTSFHIGVLKIRPSTENQDRPDVLEFYDGDDLTQVQFSVFTYDPFDIIEFFKNVSETYKKWRETVATERRAVTYQCEVKPPGFFAGTYQFSVYPDKLAVGKVGQAPTQYNLQDVGSITPLSNPSKPSMFKFTQKSQDSSEYKVNNSQQFKELLNAFYSNAFILKLPSGDQAAEPK